jgi:hypothetical protein
VGEAASKQNRPHQPQQGHTMKPKKQFSEKALESLESRIPQMAQAAFLQVNLFRV